MNPKLEIKYLESDPSKIWVCASNGRFSGAMEEYLNEDSLKRLCESLERFPKKVNDEVFFKAGEEDSRSGYCLLKFYCFDRAGHTAVRVQLNNGIASNQSLDEQNYANFKMQFEASDLDAFVSSLKSAIDKGNGVAELVGIESYTQNIYRA
jgi:hypothetical protein